MAYFRPWGEFFDTARFSSQPDKARVGPNVRFWLYNYLAVGAALVVALSGTAGSTTAIVLAAVALGAHSALHIPSPQNRAAGVAADVADRLNRKLDKVAQIVDDKVKSW